MTSPGLSEAGPCLTETERASRSGWRRRLAALAAPHPGFWALTGALLVVDGLWLAWAGIALEPSGVLAVAALVAALLGFAYLFGPVIPDPPLRGMALASASLIAFTLAAALLHYLAAGLGRPLIDAELAAAEAALGFDWRAHVAFLAEHPTLARALALAYHSSMPQVALVVVVLSARRQLGRLWAFVRRFAAVLTAVIAVSALFPALGPYAHYGVAEASPERLETVGALWHLEPVARLRGGELRAFALGDIRGLATFPSFHVALAILTAWALRPVPVLGPLVLGLNLAVIAATVSAGGHYLPDLVAGALLGLAAVFPRRGGARRLHLPATTPAPALARVAQRAEQQRHRRQA